jgi:autotransporter-associated beta strand protein
MTGATNFFHITNAGQKLTLNGAISGGFGLRTYGDPAGIVEFSALADNTYTGVTTVASGILELSSALSGKSIPANAQVGGVGGASGPATLRLAQANCISDTSTITVLSGGTFDLNFHQETIGALSITDGAVTLQSALGSGNLLTPGAVTMSGGSITGNGGLIIQSGGSITATPSALSASVISAPIMVYGTSLTITVNSGSFQPELTTSSLTELTPGSSVTKTGAGTWVVSGENTNTGSTTVSAGYLELNGNIPYSTLLLSGGGLEGTGTAAAVVSGSGTIAPAGASTTGQIATDSISLSSSLVFNVDMISGAYDSLDVAGKVSLNNAVLNLILPAAFVRKTSKVILIQNDGTDSVSGTFSGLSEGTKFTVGSQTFQITYKGGDGNDVELLTPNSAPDIGSGIIAAPSPATVNQPVSFQVNAADANADPMTVSWSWGDGASGSGSSTSHTFSAPGNYSVSVSVADDHGGTATGNISLPVNAAVPLVGSGIDSDGDGFSDAFEIAAGTSPSNAADTPTGKQADGKPGVLIAKKVKIKLNFAKANSDSISFRGMAVVPAGFTPAGKKVTFDIGGVDKSFTLDKNGSARNGKDSVKITLIKDKSGKVKAQHSNFIASFNKGSFTSSLADEGLLGTATVKNKKTSVVMTMVFNGQVSAKTEALTYNAVMNKAGVATGK